MNSHRSFWSRLPFIGRLLTTASLALVIAGATMLLVSARQEATEVRADLKAELIKELQSLPTSLAEMIVIGDFTSLQKSLDHYVSEPVVVSVSFTDTKGIRLHSEDVPVAAETPAWFLSFFNFSDITDSTLLDIGGRSYGELNITMTSRGLANRAWSHLKNHLTILLLAILLDFFGIWLVLRSGLTPLKELESGSNAIAEGNFDIRLVPHGSPELRHVIESFNRMAFSIKAAQTNLQQSEYETAQQRDFINGILDTAKSLIMVINREGAVVRINRAAEEFTGYDFEEIKDQPFIWERFLLPEQRPKVRDVFARSMTGDVVPRYENFWMQRDGNKRLFDWSNSLIQARDGTVEYLVTVGIDITARKTIEAALHESEQRWKFALEGSGAGVWDWNLSEQSLYLSKTWKEMIGYSEDEIQNTMEAFESRIHPDDKTATFDALNKCIKGETPLYIAEYRFRCKNGDYVWMLDRGMVVSFDKNGKPLRMIGAHTNINDQKTYESELQRSNAELEQFSYIISHDMRQPLRMINSYLQLISMDLGDKLSQQNREYFNFATNGAVRLDQMMVGLLEYSRVGRESEPFIWIESQALLEESLLFLRPEINQAQASIESEGQWPRLFVNRDEIVRLLQNLIGNALKYQKENTIPKIKVVSSIENNRWKLAIIDNGIGIAPTQVNQLFKIFKRLQTNSRYQGSGVGLALCRRIVEHLNGRIWAESAGEDQGSQFYVTLPLPETESLAK
ncbi:MAG: PAS domain-containing protein [Gallionellaceae bacterium]